MINLITCLDLETANIIAELFSKQYNIDSDVVNESTKHQRRFVVRGNICNTEFSLRECVNFCMSKLSYAQTIITLNKLLNEEI